MTKPGRTVLLVLAWLLTATAAGVLATFVRPPATEVRAVPADASSPQEAADPDLPRPASPVRASAGDSSPPPASGDSAPGTASAPALWPEVDVEVRRSDGTPAAGALVWLLPAGGGGADDDDRIPSCTVDDGGRARLVLPAFGTYDVGAAEGGLWTLVRDLTLEEGRPARATVVLPAGAPVTFRCDGWPPALPGEPVAEVHVHGSYEGGGGEEFTLVACPGRAEGKAFETTTLIGPNGEAVTPPLPEGLEVAFWTELKEVRRIGPAETDRQVLLSPLVLEPAHGVAKAGQTVRLSLREKAALALVIRTDPPLPPNVPLRIVTTAIRGGERQEIRCGVSGPPAGHPSEWTFRFEGTAGPARIEWSEWTEPGFSPGAAVAPGAIDGAVFEPGSPGRAEIVLRIDPTAALRPAAVVEAPADIPISISVPPGVATEDREIVLALPDPTGGGEIEVWRTDLERPEAADGVLRGRTAMAFSGPDLASVHAPLPVSGAAEIRLRPAGLLLVAPDRLPPRGAGALTLRRADGLPLASLGERGMSVDKVAQDLEVRAGLLVGPLPEGDYAFEVRLGGVRLPDAAAVVRAGRIEVLRVRTR